MTGARHVVADLLAREGLHLDRKNWQAWLDLYSEDAVFWVPAWKNEDTPTNDPDGEISLIYHDGRYGLEERVARIQSRKSVTAMPLPRTAHLVANVLVGQQETNRIEATASFTVNLFDARTTRTATHFGLYELVLRRRTEASAFVICYKKVLLMNDRVATNLDFYAI